jgi:hypothetical protein
MKDPGGADVTVWISPQVPVDGLVRVTRDGETVIELVDWGNASS